MDAPRGASPHAFVLLLPGPRLAAPRLRALLGFAVVRELRDPAGLPAAQALGPDAVVVDGAGPLASHAESGHIVLAPDEPIEALEPRLRAALGVPAAAYVFDLGRAHRLVVGQNVLLERIARGDSLTDVLDALVCFAEDELPGLLGSVLLLDDAGQHVRHGAAPHLPRAYTEMIDGAAIGPSAGSCGTAAFRGAQVIVPDIRHDPLWDGYRDLALPHGLVACWSTPIQDTNKKVLGTFALYYGEPRSPTAEELAFIDVVTAVARIAIECDRNARGLRESEARYRTIFENDMTGDLVSAADGEILEHNAAFARTFGFAVGHNACGTNELTFFPEAATRDAVLTRLRHERSLSGLELELKSCDGEPVHVLANVVGTFDDEGQLQRVAWYFLDRTAHKQLEEQLRHAQKMEAVGLLAAGVAHDFNNLLTVINSYSDLLLRKPVQPSAWKEMIGEIRDAGERAATLTSQLLALGRRQVLAPAPLDLNELVSGVDKILRRLIGEDIHIVVELSDGLGKVFADRGQLEQVLLNLALNARDAMPTGGTITIRTHVQVVDTRLASVYPGVTPGRHAALSVGDTGAGIDDETRSRIFEPFFTTKGVGKGTGLGLAIVYGIVRQSGGFIEVESGTERGTVFTVCLPICAEPATRPERLARASQTTIGHETVLLVEDEARIRRLCRQVLAEQGYRVIEAGDGLEAVALCAAEERPVDLLVTDVVMPHMNGRELADRLRASHPDMKVLYISGYTDDAIVRRGVLQGSSALLSKPFTPHVLLRRVREILDHPSE